MRKKIKAIRSTESGFFNTWTETSTINESQTIKVTKYNFYKWCLFKVTRHESNMDSYPD